MNEDEMPGPTNALPQHAWLHNLVGAWVTETEFDPTAPKGEGKETVSMFGELWAFGETESVMPDGNVMAAKFGFGYDVSDQEYRAFWIANVSSHLWQYTCELSEDGKTLTMNCEGPDMMGDSPRAHYRDVIELIDADHRTHTSLGQDKDGNWIQFMKVTYTRAS